LERNGDNPMRRDVVSLAPLTSSGLVATIVCSAAISARAGEEPIYPFQEDVEARLKGTTEENRRYALLLPLRVGLLRPGLDHAYRRAVLEQIDELDLAEALPLLEKGLAPDSTYWGGGERARAARLWMRFKTRGMDPNEQAALLASLYAPGAELDLGGGAAKSLESLGQIGKEHLLKMLHDLDKSFASNQDVLTATALAANLWRSDVLRAERHEIDELARSGNPYVKYVCLRWYSAASDTMAVQLALDLAGTPEAQKYRIRSAMLYGISACPGSEKVFLRLLSDARSEPASLPREHLISSVLCYMAADIPGRFDRISDSLRNEVFRVAERGIPPIRNPWGKELDLFGFQHKNRARAKQILAIWNRNDGAGERGRHGVVAQGAVH